MKCLTNSFLWLYKARGYRFEIKKHYNEVSAKLRRSQQLSDSEDISCDLVVCSSVPEDCAIFRSISPVIF